MSEPHVCEACREHVEDGEPDLVRAVERRRMESYGRVEWLDGKGVRFHKGCYPYISPHYRIVRDAA